MYTSDDNIKKIKAEFKVLKSRGYRNLREIPLKTLLEVAALFFAAHTNKEKEVEIINKTRDIVANKDRDNEAITDFIDSCIKPISIDLETIWQEAVDE